MEVGNIGTMSANMPRRIPSKLKYIFLALLMRNFENKKTMKIWNICLEQTLQNLLLWSLKVFVQVNRIFSKSQSALAHSDEKPDSECKVEDPGTSPPSCLFTTTLRENLEVNLRKTILLISLNLLRTLVTKLF